MSSDKDDELVKSRNSVINKIPGIAIGFAGWFVINGILWWLVLQSFSLIWLPFAFNSLGFMILSTRFSKGSETITNPQSIAIGALVAYGLNLLINVVLGGVATAGLFFVPFFMTVMEEYFSDQFGCERPLAVITMIVLTLYIKRLWR